MVGFPLVGTVRSVIKNFGGTERGLIDCISWAFEVLIARKVDAKYFWVL